MVSIRMSRQWSWTPPENKRASILFKANRTYHNVRRACADAAVADGAAEEVKKRRKKKAETDNGGERKDPEHGALGVEGPAAAPGGEAAG